MNHIFHPPARRRAALTLTLTAAALLTTAARAGSVYFSVAAEPLLGGPDRSATLLICVSAGAGAERTVDFTLNNLDATSAYISGVSIVGGPVDSGRLVSSKGTLQLWGRRYTEAEMSAARAAVPLISASGGFPNSATRDREQSLTFRYSLAPGATFDDVVTALAGAGTHGDAMKVGVRMSPWSNSDSGARGDWYTGSAPLTAPLPSGAYAGAGMLAGLMGLMYVRRRRLSRG